MSDPQSAASIPAQPVAELRHTDPSDEASIRQDAIDSRARLCFRAVSLCLAALVLSVIATGLLAVTIAFVDGAHVQPRDSPHPQRAALDQQNSVPGDLSTTSHPPAWPHAVVAVISVLLVGAVVLAIGLIRATFAMTVNTDKQPAPAKAEPANGASLPGIEMLKALTEAFSTALKGLPKR